MALEFAERIRRIPVYPVAAGYDLGERRGDARLQRVRRSGRSRRSVEAAATALVGANRYPDPVVRAAAPGAVGPLRRAAGADRAGHRLLRHPAGRRRGAARARRRGRLRMARVQRLPAPRPPPRAPGRSRCRSTPRSGHDLDAMRAEITVATRLVLICNPNNPTSTALAARGDRGSSWSGSRAHVCVILDEAYASSRWRSATPTPRSGCSTATRTSCCCAPSPRSTGSLGCGSATRSAAATAFRIAVDQVRQPFYLDLAQRRRRRSRRCATRTRSSGGWSRRSPPATSSSRAVRELGLWVAESDANFIWVRLPDEDDGAGRRRAARARRAGACGYGARRRRLRSASRVGTDAENAPVRLALARSWPDLIALEA